MLMIHVVDRHHAQGPQANNTNTHTTHSTTATTNNANIRQVTAICQLPWEVCLQGRVVKGCGAEV